MKTTNYNIRLNPDIKAQAEKTFAAFGLNLSDAINIFLYKSIMDKGLPFEVRQLDYDKAAPLPEYEYSQSYDDLNELWKDLEI
jgi:DNA-damage-inducible protein J